MELNHKIYEIYGEDGKPASISDPKNVQIIINGEPNGATLNDVFKKIAELERGSISGWSVMENYSVLEGHFVDSEGNKVGFSEDDSPIYVKRIRTPWIILNEKEVSLDYVKDVCKLLGLSEIEQTMTALSNDEKRQLEEDRKQQEVAMLEKRNREKAENEAKMKKSLEQKRLHEQEMEKRRLEEEAAMKAAEEAKQKSKAEREKLISEAKAEARKEFEAEQKAKEEIKMKAEQERQQEQKKKQEEDNRKKQEEEKKKQEEEESFSPKEFRNIKKHYSNAGFEEYVTDDDKYTLMYGEEIPEDEDPFLIAKFGDKYRELDGDVASDDDNEMVYDFEEDGDKKSLVLNKKESTLELKK